MIPKNIRARYKKIQKNRLLGLTRRITGGIICVRFVETHNKTYRGIAQSGSAPALGAGCREFESLYPDHFFLFSIR